MSLEDAVYISIFTIATSVVVIVSLSEAIRWLRLHLSGSGNPSPETIPHDGANPA